MTETLENPMDHFFLVSQGEHPLILSTRRLDHVLALKDIGGPNYKAGRRSVLYFENRDGCAREVFVDQTVDEVFELIRRK